LLANDSTSVSVEFVGSPSIELTAAKILKHKHQCTLDQFRSSSGAYEITPVVGTVRKGTVKLPVSTTPFFLGSHIFGVYVVSCV
jgi:hypothetical protein